MPHFCCGCWNRQNSSEFLAQMSSMITMLVAKLGAEAQAPNTSFFPSPHCCPGHQLCSHLPEQASAWGSSSEVTVAASWQGSSAFSLENLKPQILHSCVPAVLAIVTDPTHFPGPFLGNVPNPLSSLVATDTAQHHGQQHFSHARPLQATPPTPFPAIPSGISDVEETAQPCGQGDSQDTDGNASNGSCRQG